MISVTSEDEILPASYNRDGAGLRATQRLLQSDGDLRVVHADGAIPYPLQAHQSLNKSVSMKFARTSDQQSSA